MSRLGYHCIRTLPAILLLAALAWALPPTHKADASELDWGHFDFSVPGNAHPSAWAWVPDSTADGDGTEFIAYLSSHPVPGPTSPTVEETVSFQPGVSHADAQAFADYIVANHAHVASTSQLTIVKRRVTPVTVN